MKNVVVKIGGEVMDITDSNAVKLALTYSVADIAEIQNRNASFSKTLVLPGTDHNDQVIGFAFDVNSTNAMDQNVRRDALVEVDGTVVIEGFAKLTKNVIKNKRNVHEYHLTIMGDNSDWKQGMGELDMTDLDFSEFDHLWTKTNIDTSELIDGSGGALTKPDVVYPLINYGMNADAPHPYTNNQDVHAVRVQDRFPAFQVMALMTKMFLDQGFKIISNFMDTTFFESLYIPFTNEQMKLPDGFDTDRQFRGGMTTQQDLVTANIPQNTFDAVYGVPVQINDETSTGFFDTGGHYDTTVFNYTVDVACVQKFIATVVVETTVHNDVWLEVRIVKNYSFQNIAQGTIIASVFTQFFDVADGLQQLSIETEFEEFVAGDIVTLVIRPDGYFTPTGFFTGITTGVHVVANGTEFFNEVKLDLLEGTNIPVSRQLPDDLTQLDFLSGIKQIFNLMFLTDTVKRTVSIEPRDQFYSSTALDWTKKLDKSKDETVTYLNDKLKKTINFRYKTDSNDGSAEIIKNETGQDVASLEVANENKFVEGSQDIGAELFAPTVMDRWQYIGLNVNRVPRLNKEAIEFPSTTPRTTEFEPRLLYYKGVETLSNGESWSWEGTQRTTFPNMYSVDEVNDNDNSLYWNNTRRSSGLFQKYWRNLMNTMNDGRMYTAYFNLTDTDIDKLDFRDPIYIVDTYYLLNKIIDYNPLKRTTTKVELIKPVGMDALVFVQPLKNYPLFPPLPPDIDIPIRVIEDGGTFPGTTPGHPSIAGINTQSGGVTTTGTNNHSEQGSTVFGHGLIGGTTDQMMFGNYNERDGRAQLVMGAGIVGNRKTIAKVDTFGTFKSGNGSRAMTTISGVSQEMLFTDPDGETQVVVKSDLRESPPTEGE
jgi:hypothetical protein